MFLGFIKVVTEFVWLCLILKEHLFYGCNFIENGFNFIESHSVLVGIITAVITSSLWLRKFINQKRAEAFFDFYAKLLLKIKYLKSQLTEYSQLDYSKNSNGNIYSLLYTEDTVNDICKGYKKPEPAELKILANAADKIKECILNSNCNVYPKNADRKKWYDSQHYILSFCEFLNDNKGLQKIYNTSRKDNNGIPIHNVKCKELVEAMDYVISSIESEKY